MSIKKKLYENIIEPITLYKPAYLPIIILYFTYGISGFSAIAQTFWIKNELTLSTLDVVQLTFWANIPWTYKIIFSQFVDNISIFKSRRKSYILFGAILMIIGYLIFIATVYNITYLAFYSQLVLSSILISSGVVLQDLVADTLCLEIVICEKKQKSLSENEYKYILGIVQLLGRLSLMVGIMLAAFIGGILAKYWHLQTICWFLLIVPLISITSILYLEEAKQLWTKNHLDPKVILIIIAMVCLTTISSALTTEYKSEINFLITLIFTLVIIRYILKNQAFTNLKEIMALGIIIFFFRANTSFGPGAQWWQIDILHFTPQFFSILSQTGTLLGFLSTLIFSSYILKKNIKTVLVAIVLISSLLKLPYIGMAYGLHEWTMKNFGFGAKTIALIDVVSEDPFMILSMIPILALASYYAPKANKVIWFALVGNFMNLALSAGTLITKHLQKFFHITRENYHEIGPLMITCTIINIILPLSTMLLVGLWQKKER